MKAKRGRPPQQSLLNSFLTKDEKLEEPAPWVRINMTKTPFRPPTLFEYDNLTDHEFFDQETKKIHEIFAKKTAAQQRKEAAKQKKFWEIVHRIEETDPPKKIEDVVAEDPEDDESEPNQEDRRVLFMKQSREIIKQFDDDIVNLFTADTRERFLSRIEEIYAQPTYQSQLYLILDITENEELPVIAKLFGVARQTIKKHALRKALTKQPVGRPSILNGTEMLILKNYISEQYHSRKVPNIPMLQSYIVENFQKDVSSDTLLHMIRRNTLAKTCTGIPMEKTRCEADLDEIVQFYEDLSLFFAKNNVPDSFCFNVDESGFQPWADATNELVVIPVDANEKEIFFPIDRTTKRSSLVSAIAADGTYLGPLLIIPRKTIEKEMLACGYRPENNYHIVSQESGFITSLIWDYWVEEIFIPEVQRRRQKYNYSGDVVLLLDGCSSHSTDFFLDECTYNGITIFELPPNCSDQIQVLDLGMFGIQKRAVKKVRPSQRFSPQSKELIKICTAWQQVATPTNITAAFGEAGLTKRQIDNDPVFYMQADIKHAHQVRGIEHEPIDYPDSKKQMKLHSFS